MTFKQKIHYNFLLSVNEKVKLLQTTLAALKESAANETKSTAGDKHETALAMLQIEQANTGKQLQEAVEIKAIVEKIDPTIVAPIIVCGSLVTTNRGYFFVSAAMGKIVVDGKAIMSVSPYSPLGKQLLGLQVAARVIVNTHQYMIEDIA
jgi:hypothetical protein